MKRGAARCSSRLILRADQRGGLPALIQRGEKFAAQQGLAIAHFAGNLDEAFTVARRHQQGIERFLITGAGEEKTGVGSQAEGRFAQTEVS